MKQALTETTKSTRTSVLLGGLLLVLLAMLVLSALLVHPGVTRAEPSFTLTATPSSPTIAPGQTAYYRIAIHRRRFGGRVTLRVIGGLPAGARARFAPRMTRGSSSTLTVTTSARTPPGGYRLRLLGASGRVTARTSVILTVSRGTGQAGLKISGGVSALEPGRPQALDLSLTNPRPLVLLVTGLGVSIRRVDAPSANAALPCTLDDFSVRQYAGSYPLRVPGSSTRTLAELAIPPTQWPQVAILDRPANQNSCKRASLTLAYSGSGRFG